eukprot:SM000007S20910  [mRNA]  locus=s7:869353:870929:- [translate_table: standard]
MAARRRPGAELALVAVVAVMAAAAATASVDAVRAGPKLHPPAVAAPAAGYAGGGLVHVALYEEALCPYCARFIIGELRSLFRTGLIDVVRLRIVPYGNARVLDNGTIVCQHGPLECRLNIVLACALHHYPAVDDWFPFVECMETTPELGAMRQCAREAGLSFQRIDRCAEGELGGKLLRKYGKETDALDPPHLFVPWVVVNGQPLYEDFNNLDAYICKAYTGPKRLPLICNATGREAPLGNLTGTVGSSHGGVCERQGANAVPASVAAS